MIDLILQPKTLRSGRVGAEIPNWQQIFALQMREKVAVINSRAFLQSPVNRCRDRLQRCITDQVAEHRKRAAFAVPQILD